MEAFESWVLEYDGMTAVEKLNKYRNYYYTDGDNTEAGVIADAINEILPEYVALKSAATLNPMKIIEKARQILGKQFEYIYSSPAAIKYAEKNGDIVLECIEFESYTNYQDRIRVFDDRIVLLEEEKGYRKILFEYDSFEDFLATPISKIVVKRR